MGNHEAGRIMVKVAEAFWSVRDKTGMTALEILDRACRDHEGADAEFDFSDWPNGEGTFHEILQAAFFPEYDATKDEEGDVWYEAVKRQFRRRYNLC